MPETPKKVLPLSMNMYIKVEFFYRLYVLFYKLFAINVIKFESYEDRRENNFTTNINSDTNKYYLYDYYMQE